MESLKNVRMLRRTPIREEMIDAIDFAFKENAPESKVFTFLEQRDDLNFSGKLYVIGFGKAARGMYDGVKKFFGGRISKASIIVPIQSSGSLPYPYLPGNHPFPSIESLNSSHSLLASLKNLTSEDLVMVLISGGGSSLFEVLKEGVELKNYNETIGCMMRHGANISEINAVRYLFSEVKGGGLLKFTYPARVLGLIISDVPGDSVGTVASGPTSVPPEDHFIEETLNKYRKLCVINTPTVKRCAEQSQRVDNHVILKNSDFVQSICNWLLKRGRNTINIGSGIEGDTKYVARFIVKKMREEYERKKTQIFLVGGGETSTRYVKNGLGGRNLELALRVLLLMEEGEEFAFGSIGTDGMDGTSGAMGAIVDDKTRESLDEKYILEKLSTSDSLEPLAKTNDVLFSGSTGTNLADVYIGFYAGKNT